MEPKKNTKLYHHLKKLLEQAVVDYGMIDRGDRLLVGVSGGADSLSLLDLLDSKMIFIPEFSFTAVYIDHGFDPAYATYRALEGYFQKNGYEYVLEKTDIGPLAHSDYNRKNPCFLCSRLRRKRLFELAAEHGCNKVALAHHQDDIIETLLINMFYAREISTMVPAQSIFKGTLKIIRPLSCVRETLIKRYAAERSLPVTPTLCPTGETSRRAYIKTLLQALEKDNKNIRSNIFQAMGRVKLDYLPRVVSL
ncbi:MAG: ATP-binding protein [Smithellaceae bacterium]|nr:ATP-binding protein [Smithellaceae bacterium]